MRNELPEFYFFVLPESGKLVTIKRNEHRYYHSDWNTNDKVRNQEIADFQNRKLGITPAQQQAMQCGSMFGWKSPGANPQLYLNKAEYTVANYVKGHIKHPTMSILYPVDSVLYGYKIAGEKVYYLNLCGLSPNFMGKDSDITLLPDLVRGRPLLPVQMEQSENGTFTFQLESDSYTFEKEINATYPVAELDVMNLKILDQAEENLFFSMDEQADRRNGCIGHFRGDFGNGKQFYHNWFPHQSDKLNHEPFKSDFQRVVDWLRQDYSPLKDLDSMKVFCRRHEPYSKMTKAILPSHGFRIDTQRFQYMLRCFPEKGDYNFYIYCYDKQAREQERTETTKKAKKKHEPER